MMAADKIGPAAVKIGIRREPSQRFGFHNFRHSLATFRERYVKHGCQESRGGIPKASHLAA